MPLAQIRISNADDLHEHAKDADFLVMMFDRDEIEKGLTGDALSRLMALSDSSEFVAKFQDRVALSFDGYGDDPRELYEIPECRNFMRSLNAQWPFWYHFLEKDHDSFTVLFRLLCDVEVIHFENGSVGFRFKDGDMTRSTALSLFIGMNSLYAMHGLGPTENKAATERVVKAFNKVMGN